MFKMETKWMDNKKWWHYNKYGLPVINEDAPKEAKESYKKWCEQCKSKKS